MAYSKIVVWPSPYDTQKLPSGKYGMSYTYVECDIPLFEFSRQLWTLSPLFSGFDQSQEDAIFYTSTFYRKTTLKLFANGIEVPILEDTRRNKNLIRVKAHYVQGKDLYCQYIPAKVGELLGDQRDRLSGLYGIKCEVRYSPKIREVLQLSRQYINHMAKAIDVEPPLWVGGIGNQDLGDTDNLIPKLTPIDLTLHLKPIKLMTDIFSRFLIGRNYTDIGSIGDPKFTLSYIEGVQRILIEIDEGFKKVLA